ncbi:ribosome maturation factor RimP [Sebaldella sp. S0638]|uniref:ribosome maturation factor RimP n=1 Tax=Sebaldella sp. S0638 TaxID=2957809 RepID=UPI00209DE56C|nr:ribosome maturation factor RimP [Sebaldella sp. S0638]MCP1225278.1 ribosome maturation factor RimP [Sebaldella sp. S0638]
MEQILLEIEKTITSYLDEMNLELADLEYVSEGGYNYLRIYIERVDGVTSIEDCVGFSEKVDPLIEDFIKDKFFLEVSTPGIERRLRKERDFLRFKGKKIRLALKSKVNDKKVLTGDLVDFINNEVVVNIEGTLINIPLEKVKKANLIFEMPDFKEEV